MLLSAGLLDLASHRHKTALRRHRADDLPEPRFVLRLAARVRCEAWREFGWGPVLHLSQAVEAKVEKPG